MEAELFRVEAGDPGGVAPDDLQHPVDDLLPLRRVFHILHLLEEAVELRVCVIGRVFPVFPALAFGP